MNDTLQEHPTAVVLVEGSSDRSALETLALRLGRELTQERVSILSMGGATNVARYLEVWGPLGRNVVLAGLFDEDEEGYFRRGLERVGLIPGPHRLSMEHLGFFACVKDLEDELIRALGTTEVKKVIRSEGELESFHIFQAQPNQRERPTDAQLRRFMGTRSGRKKKYGKLLVDALDLADVPPPLLAVLSRVRL